MFETILLGWLFVVVLMLVFWLLYLLLRNPGVIDLAWSLAILLAACHYLLSMPLMASQITFMVLVILWAFRLAGYLLIARIIPGHVDKRYVKLSQQWRMNKVLGYLINYQFQGVLAVIIATPFIFIARIQQFGAYQIIGIVLFVIGLLGEIIADRQLQTFKRQHTGQVCESGLWQWSRHPNYFFEWLIWLGFALASLSVAWGWLALVSPLLLLVVMLFITGPITEQGSLVSRGQAYREYQLRTSMFIPLPPKSKKS